MKRKLYSKKQKKDIDSFPTKIEANFRQLISAEK